MKLARLCSVALAVLLLTLSAHSGRRNSAQLSENVDLPATYELDFSLASKMRPQLGPLRPTNDANRGEKAGLEVFSQLISSQTISTLGLPYHWTFSVKETQDINAGSFSDGTVVAKRGLVQLVGADRGLWAAVLSHEIAHVERRHIVREVLYHQYIQQQIEYYKLRARLGDRSAGWTAAALQIAGAIAEKKLSRDLEHDADSQGMLLMARAGYHPDYVFAMHHLMRLSTAERSKIGTFFLSDHPRWETRDQRTERAYAEALTEYNRLWPDPVLSPGGQAPLVAFLGKTKTSESEQHSTGEIVMSVSCRNANEPITVVVRLSDKEGRSLANPDSAETRRRIVCPVSDEAAPTTIHISSAVAAAHERMVRARLDFLAPDGAVLERSKEIDVHLPKIGKEARTLAKVEIDSAIAEEAQEATPENVPVRATMATQSGPPASVSPQSEAAQVPPMSFAPTVPNPISVVSIPALGMTVETNPSGGVQVVSTTSGGIAEWIGLRVGYTITAVNGRPVETEADFAAAIADRQPGSLIKLTYMLRTNLGTFQKDATIALFNEHK